MLTAAILVIVALLAASFWLWGFALRRVWEGKKLLRAEPAVNPPWGLADLLLSVVLLLVCQGIGDAWVRTQYQLAPSMRFEEMDSEPRAMLLLAGALATVVAVAGSLTWVIFRGATRRDLGISVQRARPDIRLAAAAFLMVAPVVYGMQWLLVQWTDSKHPLIELLKEHPDPRFLLLSTFSAGFVAPIAEEYFFRVLLQGWLERLARGKVDATAMLVGRCQLSDGADRPGSGREDPDFDPGNPDFVTADAASPELAATHANWWPILASSALFAVAHWSHGPDPIPLFLFAMVLGYLYQRTRRILPCIVVHFLLNACSLAALWVDVYGGAS
jgi:membrane protease YdiL (CAAX protease family)